MTAALPENMSVGKQTSYRLQKTLECAICFLQYDKGRHLPMALRCLHTFCKTCVKSIVSGITVVCPTCRGLTAPEDIRTNYTVTDILDVLCVECKRRESDLLCHHCDDHLCQSCIEEHSIKYKSDIALKIRSLQCDINGLSNFTRSKISDETHKADLVLSQIKDTYQMYRDALDKRQFELELKVSRLKKHNIDSLKSWQDKTDTQLITGRGFVETAEMTMIRNQPPSIPMGEMANIDQQCTKLVKRLEATKASLPRLAEYHFQEAKDHTQRFLNFGDIVSHVSKSWMPPSDVQPSTVVPNYKSTCLKCTVGEKGSSKHQLNYPSDIAVTSDGFILVADQLNHRIKVYDPNIECQSTFGVEGTEVGQFKNPAGLAVAPNGKVYVSDYNNHRIQILTLSGHSVKECELLRTVRIAKPQGLAFDSSGNLYICDQGNDRVQVVQQDGKYVRTICFDGSFPRQCKEKLLYVTVTKDEKVLVSQFRTSDILVFTSTGKYVGTYPHNPPTAISDRSPRDMVVDHVGNIITGDYKGRLIVLDKDGNFVCTIGSRGDQPGQLSRRVGVAIDKDGNILVSDGDNNRIQLFEIC